MADAGIHLLGRLSVLRARQMLGLPVDPRGRSTAEHLDASWLDTAAVLVDWSARLSRATTSTAGPSNLHEVDRAITAAHEWSGLLDLVHRCRALDSDTYYPTHDAVRFVVDRRKHRWDVQALQLKLDSTPGFGGPPNPGRDDARRRFITDVLAALRAGNLEAITPAITRYGRVLSREFAPSVDGDCDLGGFSLDEGLAVLGFITSLAHAGDLLLSVTGDLHYSLCGGNREALVNHCASAADVDLRAAHNVITTLTFDPATRGDARLAPFLRVGKRLVSASVLLTGHDAEVRLLRLLAARDPGLYGAIGKARGRRATAFADVFADVPDTFVASDVKVLDPKGRTVTDIDVILADPRSGTAATIQVKWPLDTTSTSGVVKVEAELAKAREQSRRAAAALEGGASLALPSSFPDPREWPMRHYVAAPDILPLTDELWTDTPTPTSLQLIRAARRELPRARLHRLLTYLDCPPLPKEDDDWIVRRYRTQGAFLTIERDGQHSRWHSHDTGVATLAPRATAANSHLVPCPWEGAE